MIHSTPSLPQSLFGAWALALWLLPAPGAADGQTPSACPALSGTYVATVTDKEDVFTSRALLTFTTDGNLLVTDSGRLGGPASPSPVDASHGSWRCKAEKSKEPDIEAVALSLSFAGRDGLQAFGRFDYRLRLSAAGTLLTGSAELRLIDSVDLEGAEPMTDPGNLVGAFHIEGVKLIVPRYPESSGE